MASVRLSAQGREPPPARSHDIFVRIRFLSIPDDLDRFRQRAAHVLAYGIEDVDLIEMNMRINECGDEQIPLCVDRRVSFLVESLSDSGN